MHRRVLELALQGANLEGGQQWSASPCVALPAFEGPFWLDLPLVAAVLLIGTAPPASSPGLAGRPAGPSHGHPGPLLPCWMSMSRAWAWARARALARLLASLYGNHPPLATEQLPALRGFGREIPPHAPPEPLLPARGNAEQAAHCLTVSWAVPSRLRFRGVKAPSNSPKRCRTPSSEWDTCSVMTKLPGVSAVSACQVRTCTLILAYVA